MKRMDLSLQHILRYADEGENMLDRLVTGDESWVHHYQPQSKRASMQWEHPNSPVSSTNFKATPSAEVTLAVFWDSQGALLAHFQMRDENVNAVPYCEVLLKLRDAIHRKRPGQLARGVLLHHDNSRPHTARATRYRLQDLQWELLEHPPYSPDLAPSDFHLSGTLKKYVGGKRFADDEEVETELWMWLRQQSKETAGFDAMGQVYQRSSRICRGINVFSPKFEYGMFYVLHTFVTYLLTAS
jgi:histone-lysine N-methyltransferase SETMAR